MHSGMRSTKIDIILFGGNIYVINKKTCVLVRTRQGAEL